MEPPTTTTETPTTTEPQTHPWTNTSHHRTTIANTKAKPIEAIEAKPIIEAKPSQHLIEAKPTPKQNPSPIQTQPITNRSKTNTEARPTIGSNPANIDSNPT